MGIFSFLDDVVGTQQDINKNRINANRKMAKRILDKYIKEFNPHKYKYDFTEYIRPIVAREVKNFLNSIYTNICNIDHTSEDWYIYEWMSKVQRLNSGRLSDAEMIENVLNTVREEIFKYPDDKTGDCL